MENNTTYMLMLLSMILGVIIGFVIVNAYNNIDNCLMQPNPPPKVTVECNELTCECEEGMTDEDCFDFVVNRFHDYRLEYAVMNRTLEMVK